MQIGQPKRIERGDGVGVERHRVGFAAIIGDAVGRQSHADAVSAPDSDHGLRHFHQETRAVLDRAAIAVGAQIDVGLQELLDQIAVGAVDLDAVEPGLQCIFRRLPVGLDHAWYLGGFERAWRLIGRDFSVRCRSLERIRNRHRRRRHRQHAAGLERGMRDTPDMPELEKDHAALGVNRIDDGAPALDLRLRVDAGHAGSAETGRRDRRGLGDQQSARCSALRIIFRIERPRRRDSASPPASASAAPARRDA